MKNQSRQILELISLNKDQRARLKVLEGLLKRKSEEKATTDRSTSQEKRAGSTSTSTHTNTHKGTGTRHAPSRHSDSSSHFKGPPKPKPTKTDPPAHAMGHFRGPVPRKPPLPSIRPVTTHLQPGRDALPRPGESYKGFYDRCHKKYYTYYRRDPEGMDRHWQLWLAYWRENFYPYQTRQTDEDRRKPGE